MEEKRRFKAKIAGKEYTIVGSRTARHLNAVVDIVNQQLDQLSNLAPELSVGDRSVLMAINAVSDQLVKEQRIMELEEEIKQLKADGHLPVENQAESGSIDYNQPRNTVRKPHPSSLDTDMLDDA